MAAAALEPEGQTLLPLRAGDLGRRTVGPRCHWAHSRDSVWKGDRKTCPNPASSARGGAHLSHSHRRPLVSGGPAPQSPRVSSERVPSLLRIFLPPSPLHLSPGSVPTPPQQWKPCLPLRVEPRSAGISRGHSWHCEQGLGDTGRWKIVVLGIQAQKPDASSSLQGACF